MTSALKKVASDERDRVKRVLDDLARKLFTPEPIRIEKTIHLMNWLGRQGSNIFFDEKRNGGRTLAQIMRHIRYMGIEVALAKALEIPFDFRENITPGDPTTFAWDLYHPDLDVKIEAKVHKRKYLTFKTNTFKRTMGRIGNGHIDVIVSANLLEMPDCYLVGPRLIVWAKNFKEPYVQISGENPNNSYFDHEYAKADEISRFNETEYFPDVDYKVKDDVTS